MRACVCVCVCVCDEEAHPTQSHQSQNVMFEAIISFDPLSAGTTL